MRAPIHVLLIAAEEAGTTSASDRALRHLVEAVEALGYHGVRASTLEDGLAFLRSEPSYGCIVLDWDLRCSGHVDERAAVGIIQAIRQRNRTLPIFLLADRTLVNDLPLAVLREVHEYVHLTSETPAFLASRLDFAVRQYREVLLPPYFRELKRFTESGAYSWDAPGHMGGMAYLKHPIGAEFHHFFGENIMRADIGISTPELGDWLEHAGPVGASERNAARIFGAQWTFYVLSGSSNSNRIVCQAAIGANEMVVADRNCHKSLNHGLTLSQARVVYLEPTRNGHGMIGPIPPAQFEPAHIRRLVEGSPLAAGSVSQRPTHAVVTNCTYDGLCYDVNRLASLLAESIPSLHFDEAWYAYAKFHPLYRGRFAMGIPPDMPGRPTLFAVQSTHKMLPAFSMASYIHVQPSPRAPMEFDEFNESFMMHGTTSPFYPLIASIDVATAMMDEPAGPALMQETVRDAIRFRKAIATAARKVRDADRPAGWFFGVFQPDRVADPDGGAEHDFADAPDDLLAREPGCWTLDPHDTWHGFDKAALDGGWCMLDPTKVTILSPGIDAHGRWAERGIPGAILTNFLDSRRTEIARTGDYTLLVLFSVGTSTGKWGTLLETLFEFKRLYDDGASVVESLPELAARHPDRYGSMTLRAFCDEMHAAMRELDLPGLAQQACGDLPQAVLSSWETHQRLVRNGTVRLPVAEMAGRISAHMLVPYPPGIPIVMPGERFGPAGCAHIRFLLALQEFGRRFPGFEHEVHGIEVATDGTFWMRCVKEDETQPVLGTPQIAAATRRRARKRGRA